MTRPRTPECLIWLRENGHDLAPLTGTDRRVLLVLDALWQTLPHVGRANAEVLSAARSLLPMMQAKCRPLARELIARALDWDDRDRLWPLVCAPERNSPPGGEVTAP